MIKNKIKKAFSYIFAEDEDFSLEYRLFLSTTIVGLLISIVGGFIISVILSINFVPVFISLLLSGSLFIIYYYARFKRIIEPFIIPIIILSFIGIFTFWVFEAGMSGPNMLPAFVILIFALIIVPERKKKYFILLFIAFVIIVYLIQYYRPDLIVDYPSETSRWIDSFFTTIYSAFCLYLIIIFFHKYYTVERIRAEESEEKYKLLFENSPNMNITVSPVNDSILMCNETFLKISGYPIEDVIGRPFSDFYYEEISDEETISFKQFVDSNKTKNKEIILKQKDGSKIYTISNVNIIKDKNDIILYFILTLNDITFRKLSESKIQQQNYELQKLNADKDRFISILSHDLKSPFNTILGYTELLLEDLHKYSSNDISERLGIIHDMSKKSFDLLEDLLLWSKSASGKLNFQPKKIDFTKTCKKTIESLKPNAIAKSITINYFSTDELTLWADENMLKTVLRNLVSNAIKFTNPKGRINVYAEKEQNNIIITVSDNGVGIDENDFPKLWDIVTKHSTYGTANEKGTGLGLLLCKEFVEKHGGRIWVESVLGKGSDFKFTIPFFNGRQI